MEIHSPNKSEKTIHAHRCIIKARAPQLYADLKRWHEEGDDAAKPRGNRTGTPTTGSSGEILEEKINKSQQTVWKITWRKETCSKWHGVLLLFFYLYKGNIVLFRTTGEIDLCQEFPDALKNMYHQTEAALSLSNLLNLATSSDQIRQAEIGQDATQAVQFLARRYSLSQLDNYCKALLNPDGGSSAEREISLSSTLLSYESLYSDDINQADETADVLFLLPNGRTIAAHRAIVSARSGYLKALLKATLGPTVNIEPPSDESGVEMTPELFMQMLKYFYTDQIEINQATCLEIYGACQFMITGPALKERCDDEIQRIVVDDENVEDLKKWAEQYDHKALLKRCENYSRKKRRLSR